MNAEERRRSNNENKISQSLLLRFLWTNYITKNARYIDQYGDPEYWIDEIVYSTTTNLPGAAIQDIYVVMYNNTAKSGWFYLTNEELDSLCKRFYTEEEIETAKLQLELRE